MTQTGDPGSLKILFVCIGNSCRSQMAEALANHLGGGRIQVFSAGSHPLGEIVPKTAAVLAEKGISLDGHWSKSLKDVPVSEMNVIVTMGCEVECPVPPEFRGRVIEWNVHDPFGYELSYFRSVRDLIERQVKTLLNDVLNSKPGAEAAESEA